MKNTLIYVAACLIFLSLSFTFTIGETESQISWMWADKIQVPIILWVFAMMVLVHYYLRSRSLRGD